MTADLRLDIVNGQLVVDNDRPMPGQHSSVWVLKTAQDVENLLVDAKECNLTIEQGDALYEVDETTPELLALVEQVQAVLNAEPEREMDAFDRDYERERANGWAD
jgi:hypothetical protein